MGGHTLSALDASIVDVYKHTNAVVFVFDLTKPWTLDYIKREIPKVPKGINIVVLANCRDLSDKRQVQQRDIESLLKGTGIQCIETSAKNCYGLKQLYTYFNLPYLELKLDNLKRQIQTIEEERDACKEEVQLTIESSDYDTYIKYMKDTRSRPINTVPFSEERTATIRRTSTINAQTPQQPPTPTTPSNQSQQQQQQSTPTTASPQTKPTASITKQTSPKQPTVNKNKDDDFYDQVDDSFYSTNAPKHQSTTSPNNDQDEDTYASTAITTQQESSDDEEDLIKRRERPMTDSDVNEEDMYVTNVRQPIIKPQSKLAPLKQPKDDFYNDERERNETPPAATTPSSPQQKTKSPTTLSSPVDDSPSRKPVSPVILPPNRSLLSGDNPITPAKVISPGIVEDVIDDGFFDDDQEDAQQDELQIHDQDDDDQDQLIHNGSQLHHKDELSEEEEEEYVAPVKPTTPARTIKKIEILPELLEAANSSQPVDKKKKKKTAEGDKKKKKKDENTGAAGVEKKKKKKKKTDGSKDEGGEQYETI
ncbi:Rab-like protein [Acrasis kona]|uniref:Rab-like protein n=1 Tax=Acrasis kona TaxID=1008807 RepID=A0AAW2Z6R0_9EUKA